MAISGRLYSEMMKAEQISERKAAIAERTEWLKDHRCADWTTSLQKWNREDEEAIAALGG